VLRALAFVCWLGLQMPYGAAAGRCVAYHERAGLEDLHVQGRKVLVHLPPGYDGSKALPLVLALHGGGGHAALMAEDSRYGWQRQADQGGFIVAFPNGASRLPTVDVWRRGMRADAVVTRAIRTLMMWLSCAPWWRNSRDATHR
jgi:poly(3-hydroxybutyrate) depolymerase